MTVLPGSGFGSALEDFKDDMAERAHPKEYRRCWRNLWQVNPWQQHMIDRYEFCNQYVENKAVLDAGCGTGWGSSYLAGMKYLCGIDYSSDAIEYARSHCEGDFTVGSICDLPYGAETFDAVLCLEVLEHLTFLEGQDFLREASRVLRPGGLLILNVPILTDRMNSRNPYHLCEYYEPELRTVISKDFEIDIYDHVASPAGIGVRCILRKRP